MPSYRLCRVCGQKKRAEAFNMHRARRRERKLICKKCEREYLRNHYAENKGYYKAKAHGKGFSIRDYRRLGEKIVAMLVNPVGTVPPPGSINRRDVIAAVLADTVGGNDKGWYAVAARIDAAVAKMNDSGR